jgi:hypothetical protein
MKKKVLISLGALAIFFVVVLFGYDRVFAHCDGLDGPVIVDAKKALESGDVNLILIWVQKKDEAEIRKVFQKTLAVRKLNPEAKELADMYFFETLVRVHRAGEGEPYTGIKPAGRDLGPAIPAADKAVADGKLEPLYRLLTEKIHEGLHQKFESVMKKKNFKKEDVQAGREYVEAYVPFIHYVEALYEMTTKEVHGHSPEAEKGEGHKH